MHIQLHHLVLLGAFSILGWFAFLWFVGGAIRARHDARRAEALYLRRSAECDAIINSVVAEATAKENP